LEDVSDAVWCGKAEVALVVLEVDAVCIAFVFLGGGEAVGLLAPRTLALAFASLETGVLLRLFFLTVLGFVALGEEDGGGV